MASQGDGNTKSSDTSNPADPKTATDAAVHAGVQAALQTLSATARAAGRTVAVAESLTCGRLAHTIGGAQNASDWFLGGAVVYRMESKVRVLGVDPQLDPCSAECAEQLAAGALRVYAADAAVAATGVGGPDAEDGHEPGTVYLGWATADGVGHRLLELDGSPVDVLDQTVLEALRELTEHLR